MIKARTTFDRSKFRRVKDSLETKALKKVIRQQSSVISRKVKSNTPKDTGALKFSIGTKVLTRRNSATAIIGARADYSKDTGKGLRKPIRYAQLAEQRTQYLARSMTSQDIDQLRELVANEVKAALR